MNISEIKIRKTFTDGALRGIVSVTIDDCLAIHDIKVVQGRNDNSLLPGRICV